VSSHPNNLEKNTLLPETLLLLLFLYNRLT
jgi:hypothetical protein